mmetsp:Transcript_52086/g.91531  ORF Transcript_52086/g.91531 Transcript_52086/m.91531 type:complete len:423 (+) Transcript_52086:74-1342(+)
MASPSPCPEGAECPFWRAALEYEASPEILHHLQCCKHPGRVPCKYAGACTRFKRVEAGEYRIFDIIHLQTYIHPPRMGRPMSVEAHAYSSASEGWVDDCCGLRGFERMTSYHAAVGEFNVPLSLGGKQLRQPENRSCGPNTFMTPTIDDLVKEIRDNGFGQELQIPNAQQPPFTLMDHAVDLGNHPLNVGVFNPERQLAPPARSAAILAVILYTGTEVFSAYNTDKRKFYQKADEDSRGTPRFPCLDKLLMEARFCLSPVTQLEPPPEDRNPRSIYEMILSCESYLKPEILWCGMHKAYLSREDKSNGRLRLAQDTSTSRSRDVAEFFLCNQGAAVAEGTLFKLIFQLDGAGPSRLRGRQDQQMLLADLSWISKFPDEEETLVEAGTLLHVKSITTLTETPLVELVEGILDSPAGRALDWRQ